MTRIAWGQGSLYGSFICVLEAGGIVHTPFAAWTSGSLEVRFGQIKKMPPFGEETKRREFLERLNGLPGVNLSADSYHYKSPTFRLSVLGTEEGWAGFERVLEWYLGAIEGAR